MDRQIETLGERKGIPIYASNPSIPPAGELRARNRQVQIAKGKDALVINGGTGELLGKASAAFMHTEDVDPTKFVKIFLEGVKQIAGLSKAGMSVFEIVYAQTQENSGKDQIVLSAYHGKKAGLTQRTYYRGLRDLLEKELLYASPVDNIYFLNIRYLFNGNRLHFVRSYHLKELGRHAAPELGFDEESTR